MKVLCFTRLSLQEDILDFNISVSDIQTIWADRDMKRNGKIKGSGIAVLVNNKWHNPGYAPVKSPVTEDLQTPTAFQAITGDFN